MPISFRPLEDSIVIILSSISLVFLFPILCLVLLASEPKLLVKAVVSFVQAIVSGSSFASGLLQAEQDSCHRG